MRYHYSRCTSTIRFTVHSPVTKRDHDWLVHSVPGYRVDVDGWQIFIHWEVFATRRDNKVVFASVRNSARWTASEMSSGARITFYPSATRDEATQNAMSWILRNGPEKVAGMVMKFLADRGDARDVNFNEEVLNVPADYVAAS